MNNEFNIQLEDEQLLSIQLENVIINIPTGITDWTDVGYSYEPYIINTAHEYAKYIQDTWTPPISGDHLFYGYSELIVFPVMNCKHMSSTSSMFGSCTSLMEIPDLHLNPMDAGGMFNGCTNLRFIDLTNFDISRLTNVSYMFKMCYNLNSMDFSNFTIPESGILNMSNMFQQAYQGQPNGREIKFFKCNDDYTRDLNYIFDSCTSLAKVDMSGFNSKISYFGYAFRNCQRLEEIDISGIDLTTITNYTQIFRSTGSGLTDGKLTKVYVKNKDCQDWILNLSSNDRPNTWSTENVIIKG